MTTFHKNKLCAVIVVEHLRYSCQNRVWVVYKIGIIISGAMFYAFEYKYRLPKTLPYIYGRHNKKTYYVFFSRHNKKTQIIN